MKIFFKYLGYALFSLAAFFVCYLLIAYILSRITISEEINQSDDVKIYIKTNGIHTDIVVPVKNLQMDWSKEIKFSDTKLNDSCMKYIAIGWGDKGFFLKAQKWADLKVSIAFKAAFGLSTTAIHATFFDTIIENKSCKKIIISNAQYCRLVAYILTSFKKDDLQHVMNIKTNATYSNKDAFYEANGKYSMLFNCNTWANNALKHCGQRACLWTVFDTGIFLKY